MALNVKFLKGTAKKYEEYKVNSLIEPSSFYHIDGKDLYLGLIKLSNAEDIAAVEESLSNRILKLEAIDYTQYAIKSEVDNKILSLTEQVEEVKSNLEDVKLIIGDSESGLVKSVIDLKTLTEGHSEKIVSLEELIINHSKLLDGIDSSTSVKSLIDAAVTKSDTAQQTAENAAAAVIQLSSNVYTKEETINEINAAINEAVSWNEIAQKI